MATVPRIIASVLGADYARLGNEVSELEEAGVAGIQWDIMDGVFVPSITFGAAIVEACRRVSTIPFEAHLMVVHPERHIDRFLDAGCETVIVHAEATADIATVVGAISERGGRAGVALSPATPIGGLEDHLAHIDRLLIMTVEPGAGGQPYRHHVEEKISEARRLIDKLGLPTVIEVDGGITPKTIATAQHAGADLFVSGSWILRHTQGKAAAVKELAQAGIHGK